MHILIFGKLGSEGFVLLFSAWGGVNVRRARGWAALLRVRGPVPHRPALLQTHPGLEVERRGRALGASSGEVDGGGGLG